MKKLTHLDARGRARMVDVADKAVTLRRAAAEATVHMRPQTLAMITKNKAPKGDVIAVARIAGIQAAKKCGELIPLCHPLPIHHAEVEFDFPDSLDRIVITATARIDAKTGVEMEALTAVTVAALTIYDMCKAVDKAMVIRDVRLLKKTKQAV